MDKRYLIFYYFNNYEFDTNYILNTIKIHNIEYTENSNGIFINLSLVKDTIIDNIYENLDILIKSRYNKDVKEEYHQVDKKSVQETPKLKDKINYSSIDKLLLLYSKQTITI